MNTSLRLVFTCSLLALPLVACGDDGGTTDTNSTQSTTNDVTTSTTTDTTAGPTTDNPTTGTPTTDDTTTDTPGTTTTGPDTTTTGPDTTTTEPDTTTTEPDTTTGDTTTTTTGGGLSWEMDVFPEAVMGNCGCHAMASGGLTITGPQDSHANLVDVDSTQAPGFKRVAPGDPANSYLLAKLKGVHLEGPFMGSGVKMPLGAPSLPADTIALVEQWIADGAAP